MSKHFGIFPTEEIAVNVVNLLFEVGLREEEVHVVGERGRRVTARYTQSPESDGMNPHLMGAGMADVLIKPLSSSDSVRSRLAGLDVPHGLLDHYEEQITRGAILVMVETDDPHRATEANRILQSSMTVS